MKDTYANFIAKGGTVTVLAGFTETKPLPKAKHPEKPPLIQKIIATGTHPRTSEKLLVSQTTNITKSQMQ